MSLVGFRGHPFPTWMKPTSRGDTKHLCVNPLLVDCRHCITAAMVDAQSTDSMGLCCADIPWSGSVVYWQRARRETNTAPIARDLLASWAHEQCSVLSQWHREGHSLCLMLLQCSGHQQVQSQEFNADAGGHMPGADPCIHCSLGRSLNANQSWLHC